MSSIMAEQAQKLYNLCDLENKGYINKGDMQRLQAYLPLNQEQLESVFDSLDDDGNGCLTLSEFTTGFGSFIVGAPAEEAPHEEMTSSYQEEEEAEEMNSEYEEQFKLTMQELASVELIDESGSMDTIRELWIRMRKRNPELLPGFESMLGTVAREIRKTDSEYKNLEYALRGKLSAHDEEVRKLYEEMENQIKSERERLINEERLRERKLREHLEQEIREKDRLYHEILRKQDDLQAQLKEVNAVNTETVQERENLDKEREELKKTLEANKASLKDAQEYLKDLNKKVREERRKRAKAAIAMTEGIALEREEMVRQLDMQRKLHESLKGGTGKKAGAEEDEDGAGYGEILKMGKKDDSDGEEKITPKSASMSQAAPGRQAQIQGHAEVIPAAANIFSASALELDDGGMEEEDCEFDVLPEEFAGMAQASSPMVISGMSTVMIKSSSSSGTPTPPPTPPPELASTGVGTDPIEPPPPTTEVEVQTDRPPTPEPPPSPPQPRAETPPPTPVQEEEVLPVRTPPDGAPTEPKVPVEPEFRGLRSPERVFKVVFIGDSGVGKSSVIYRFMDDNFKSTFSATIGVDFQIKSMALEDKFIALQIWDTAGQERFRSITQQYFRKADGVILTYDVTHFASFMNVREWMQSVKEGTEEGTILMLLGNKCDLSEEVPHGTVTTKEGDLLAKEFGAIFYEVSAKSGLNVQEAFHELAQRLKDTEDSDLRNSIKVGPEQKKKKGCCG